MLSFIMQLIDTLLPETDLTSWNPTHASNKLETDLVILDWVGRNWLLIHFLKPHIVTWELLKQIYVRSSARHENHEIIVHLIEERKRRKNENHFIFLKKTSSHLKNKHNVITLQLDLINLFVFCLLTFDCFSFVLVLFSFVLFLLLI